MEIKILNMIWKTCFITFKSKVLKRFHWLCNHAFIGTSLKTENDAQRRHVVKLIICVIALRYPGYTQQDKTLFKIEEILRIVSINMYSTHSIIYSLSLNLIHIYEFATNKHLICAEHFGMRSSAGARKIYKRKDDQTVANPLPICHGHNDEILNMSLASEPERRGGGA